MRPSAYIIPMVFPLVGLWGLYTGGLATALFPIVAFVLIPLFELFLKGRGADEYGEGGEHSAAHDMVLGFGYLMVWIGFFLLIDRLAAGSPSLLHTVGLIFCSGILFGAVGINVAHELGHRRNKLVRSLGQALLFPSFYMHFTIEHNRGHHRWMATMTICSGHGFCNMRRGLAPKISSSTPTFAALRVGASASDSGS